MAPDLDVLITSPTDPLLALEYHRQFTHSLLFIPIGGLLCALALFWLVRKRVSFAATYAYCCLGYATHGLLDACTSYGTQLLWPFSSLRVAWNNVSVVDPLLTIPLLCLVAAAAFRKRPGLARAGVFWVVLYLTAGVVQRERAVTTGWEIATLRGHAPTSLDAKPSFGNLALWKTIYEYQGRYHVDAVRLLAEPTLFEGQSIPSLEIGRDFPWLDRNSQQARDIERFRWFSDGFIARDPNDHARVIDIRYSMLPNEIDALWGLELNAAAGSNAHAGFVTARTLTPEQRSKLLKMLWPASSN